MELQVINGTYHFLTVSSRAPMKLEGNFWFNLRSKCI